MALDSAWIDPVRRSWALAAADPARTSQVFYATLFRLDPTTKPLFVGDLELQGRKLADTLGFIVDNLDAPDVLLPAARDLAIRHVSYNVTPDQYASVGAALLSAFEQLLGPSFDTETHAAWAQTYGALCDVMIEAAYPGHTSS